LHQWVIPYDKFVFALGYQMTIKDILSIAYTALSKLSKNKLLRALQSLREEYIELEKNINELKAENAKLKEALISQKIKSVNTNANKPSSKQPEWEEKGVGNDGKGKKKRKGRGKKPRKGAGNRPKDIKPNRTEKAKVDRCSLCGKDLSDQEPLESTNERIIEDIPDVVEKLEVIQIEQEKKYCDECKEVITAQYHIDLLPVGGLMFTVYQDPRLCENVFWPENIDLGAFATCD